MALKMSGAQCLQWHSETSGDDDGSGEVTQAWAVAGCGADDHEASLSDVKRGLFVVSNDPVYEASIYYSVGQERPESCVKVRQK